MEGGKIDLEQLLFSRAGNENVNELLSIIHRCINEVNCKDYASQEIEKYIANHSVDWLVNIIDTRHYYEVRYQGKTIACGGVSRDYSQEGQSYLTAVFVNPDYHGKGIGRKLVLFLERDEWCLDSNYVQKSRAPI